MLFWLIETKSQLKKYFNRGYKEAFVEIIPYNYHTHPCDNNISLLYIRPVDSRKGFMISISHSESLPVEIDDISEITNSLDKIYVRDKKEYLHYIINKNVIDLTLNKEYNPQFTNAHHFINNKFHNRPDVNKIIPITKHYEFCENIFNNIKDRINVDYNKFYNNKTSLVLNSIERNGIKINKEEFNQHFHHTEEDIVYTQYNFKTTTTRPSNHFNKINFAALNKDNGCRKSFIPENDKFIELDVTAYHPTILSHLIGYKFKNPDIHGEFAKMYKTDYQKSKQITFQMIYGGIFDKYKDLEFFKLVQNYTDKLWNKFNTDGFVECEISKFRFYKDKLEDMNPSKLLNYIIQQKETIYNTLLLWDIIKILRNKKTKLVLTCYDSFLFDFDETEEEVLEEVRNVFRLKDLQIKEKTGYNYHTLI